MHVCMQAHGHTHTHNELNGVLFLQNGDSRKYSNQQKGPLFTNNYKTKLLVTTMHFWPPKMHYTLDSHQNKFSIYEIFWGINSPSLSGLFSPHA